MYVPRVPFIKVLILLACGFLGASAAFGEEVGVPAGGRTVPCAVLEKFDGDVQILDSTRNQLLRTTLKATVPCGGWVSVRDGWAEIRHREGHVIKMGPQTFLEVYDPTQNPGSKSPDQIVLYRGRLWVDSPVGVPEARISTANARVVIPGSTAFVAYHPDEEETQLLTVHGAAQIANRYVQSRQITVRSGEMSTFNLKLLRVVPTAASAVDLASLKAFMVGMPIDPRQQDEALATAQRRVDRKFASKLEGSGRKIASTEDEEKVYGSHPVGVKGESEARSEWLNHLTGGDAAGRALLKSRKPAGKVRRKAQVEVLDPGVEQDRQKFKDEEAEKQRLIDELSKIRGD